MTLKTADGKSAKNQTATAESVSFDQLVRSFGQLYDVIYYVDLDSDEYTEYHCDEDRDLNEDIRGTDFFNNAMSVIENSILKEDHDVIAKSMEKSTFIKDLDDNGCVVLNFRLMQDERAQYASLFAVRPTKDAKHAIIAISNIDSARRRELQMVEKFGIPMEFSTRDKLTRVKNKYAYTKASEELNQEIYTNGYADVAVVVADINGLAYVNETNGQEAGDEYIKNACHLICSTFKHSPVFRIGGDEFAVFLKGEDFENRDRLMGELERTVITNKISGLVTIASGMAVFDFATDHDIETVFDRADQAMLENKRLLKS